MDADRRGSDPWALVICALVPYPVMGGGHKRSMRLLEAVERAGVRPHVVAPLDEDPEGAGTLRARGWDVDVVPEPARTPRSRARQHLHRLPSPYLTGVAARVRELRGRGPAFALVDHTQNAYYADELADLPTVLSLHNVDSALAASIARDEPPGTIRWLRAWNRWQAMRAVERRATPGARAVLCVSEADRAHFAARGAEALLTPNGVDDDLFAIAEDLPASEEVLFFGQFDYSPNEHGMLRFLREGWPRLAAARPAARLRLVGKGMGDALTRAAGAAERVDVVGRVPDMTPELARARIILAPLWQGGGTRIKVLEALAAGRPLVGTPLGVEGIGVVHDRHALISDDPAGLASAAARLLEDRARSAALAREGRILAQGYRWTTTLQPARDLFAELARAPGRVVHSSTPA